jgi:hypothetical protein
LARVSSWDSAIALETASTFNEKDIFYSLVACEFLDVRLPWAKAQIMQHTHVLDMDSKEQDQAADPKELCFASGGRTC